MRDDDGGMATARKRLFGTKSVRFADGQTGELRNSDDDTLIVNDSPAHARGPLGDLRLAAPPLEREGDRALLRRVERRAGDRARRADRRPPRTVTVKKTGPGFAFRHWLTW